MGWDLDPRLWTPFNSKSADANWIWKIYSIVGVNWRTQMEEYKNDMLTEIARVRDQKQKTSHYDTIWEAVESGNCAKCGQKAKIRSIQGEDRNRYCSPECYFENLKIKTQLPKFDLVCQWCYKKGKDIYKMEDGGWYHKPCFLEKKLDKPQPSRLPPRPKHQKNEWKSEELKRFGAFSVKTQFKLKLAIIKMKFTKRSI